jgi:hypothetical protein
MIDTLNDGSDRAPRLKVYLNNGNLADLPEWSIWPSGLEGAEAVAKLKEDGFEGVQDGDPAACRAAGIGSAGSGRVDAPTDALELAKRLQDAGHEGGTCHVGTGFEDDAEMDVLVNAVVEASARTGFPLFIETHRATLTQDIWRTIQLVERIPEIRFNGDFSHYYTGHEMPYGDFHAKLTAMEPIFERIRFMHGRIGNTSCMQVDIGDGSSPAPQEFGHSNFLSDFRKMWTRAMRGLKRSAGPGDILIFATEILSPKIYYGRMFTGPDSQLREECDRYQQALAYARIARECWADA